MRMIPLNQVTCLFFFRQFSALYSTKSQGWLYRRLLRSFFHHTLYYSRRGHTQIVNNGLEKFRSLVICAV